MRWRQSTIDVAKDLLAIFGGDKPSVQSKAVGFDSIVENDGFGNYTQVYKVYLTSLDHDDEFEDLAWFDVYEDAENYAKKAAKVLGMKYVGEYDA